MDRLTLRYTVSGRVQGVFYRASTAECAARLDLNGWVRNLPDGRVEVVASGPARAIEEFAAWLWQGPARAEVSGVSVEEWSGEVEPGFSVLRSQIG